MRVRGRSNKFNILAVARYPVGGIRTYLKYVYGQLDPTRFKFTIAATTFPETGLLLHDLSDFEVDILESEEEAGNLGLLRCTREALRRFPVDLIHSQGLTAGLLAIVANWGTRCPHVITHHDVFREGQFFGIRGWFKRRLMAAVLGWADLIVCVTEDARRNFCDYLPWFHAAKLTVVRHGIDTAAYAGTADLRAALGGAGRTDTPFIFGFLGRFMPQKGFDVLIDAVAELTRNGDPARQFQILSTSQEDRIGRYKAEIRRRGLERFFVFSGFTNLVNNLLGKVDCVVMPSRWEAAGLVAMESLVAGCPLIASDCIGLREVVRDTPTLLMVSEDPVSLVLQMKRAMASEADLRAAFRDFTSVARNRFDVRRTGAAMEEIFLRLAPNDRS